MLKKLDSHIISAIFTSTLVVLFALLSIDVLGKIIAEIDILGVRDYNFIKLLSYVFGLIPLKLTQFFPMALLIGALMGLGKLAASNELTIMQITGISRLRIGLIGFIVALFLGSIVLLITEYGGVPLHKHVTQLRAEALGEVTNNYGHSGIWAQDKNHFVNIRGVSADGKLANVRIYILNENMRISHIREAKTVTAKQGEWQLHDIKEKQIFPSHIQVKQSKQAVWKNNLDKSVMSLLLSDPENLSIRDLYRYIHYQKSNGIRPTNYSMTFWQRVFIPLSTGVMFLLALPFIFGSQRNSSQGRKLFLGVILGLTYYISYTSIANIILLTGAPVLLGAILPIAVFSAVSFSLLWARG